MILIDVAGAVQAAPFAAGGSAPHPRSFDSPECAAAGHSAIIAVILVVPMSMLARSLIVLFN
jgi:hypothetical protein